MHLYFDERTAQMRAAKPIQIFEPTIVCWYGNEKRGVEVTAVADNPTPVVNRGRVERECQCWTSISC